MRHAHPLALLTPLVFGLLAGCGGTDGAPAEEFQPVSFIWTGIVASIEDGNSDPVAFPGIAPGDTFEARMAYDPADVSLALSPIADGEDYDVAGSFTLVFEFQSGAVIERQVNRIRARENGGAADQWNWKDGGDVVFQANDPSNSSWALPLPADFETMHEMFMSAQGNFGASTGNHLRLDADEPEDTRVIDFENQDFVVVHNVIIVS